MPIELKAYRVQSYEENYKDCVAYALPCATGGTSLIWHAKTGRTWPIASTTQTHGEFVALLLALALGQIFTGSDSIIYNLTPITWDNVPRDVKRAAGYHLTLDPNSYAHALKLAVSQGTGMSRRVALKLTLELLYDLGYGQGADYLRSILKWELPDVQLLPGEPS